MWDSLTKFILATRLVQFVLALAIWSTIGWMAIHDQAIPQILIGAGSLVLGFFFGVQTVSNSTPIRQSGKDSMLE